MLHLVYLLRLTKKARENQKEFKLWLKSREEWFYRGIYEAKNSRFYVRTIGDQVHAIEHMIAFDDEASWGRYRAILRERSNDPGWEKRRCEQEEWWEIAEAKLLNDYSLGPSETLELE